MTGAYRQALHFWRSSAETLSTNSTIFSTFLLDRELLQSDSENPALQQPKNRQREKIIYDVLQVTALAQLLARRIVILQRCLSLL
jgi:hypothetical protein